MEAACHHLQPVMETVWALLSVHALDVEVVRKVKRDSEARFYRNNVLTGHSMRWGVRVSWTEQMSIWLIKYTASTGYWAMEKRKKSFRFTHKHSMSSNCCSEFGNGQVDSINFS